MNSEPECMCFEYEGDNPYCPKHGKAGSVPTSENEAEETEE